MRIGPIVVAAALGLPGSAFAASRALPEAPPSLPAAAAPAAPAGWVQLELPFPPAIPAAPPLATSPAPAPLPPAPPTAPQFNQLIFSMYSYKKLEPEQRAQLDGLVETAVARKDVVFLTQMALLTSAIADPQTRNRLYMAVYLLKLRNLLVYSKNPDDFQVGLDAEKAIAAIERFSYRPIEETLDASGRPSSGRRWIYLQLRSRYLAGYVQP